MPSNQDSTFASPRNALADRQQPNHTSAHTSSAVPASGTRTRTNARTAAA